MSGEWRSNIPPLRGFRGHVARFHRMLAEGAASPWAHAGILKGGMSMAHRNTWRLGRGKQGGWLSGQARWQGLLVLPTLALLACGWTFLGEASSRAGVDGNETPVSQGWMSLGLGGGGAMYTPAISPVDPNLILLGCDMSGAYRTTDGGRNWEMIHYRQLNGSTTVRPAWHPNNPSMAWAVDGWRGRSKLTRDKGRTWASVPGAPSGVTAIGIDPGQPDLLLAGGRRGFARSTDGGKTWENVGPVHGRLLGFHFDRTSPARAPRLLRRYRPGGLPFRRQRRHLA